MDHSRDYRDVYSKPISPLFRGTSWTLELAKGAGVLFLTSVKRAAVSGNVYIGFHSSRLVITCASSFPFYYALINIDNVYYI